MEKTFTTQPKECCAFWNDTIKKWHTYDMVKNKRGTSTNLADALFVKDRKEQENRELFEVPKTFRQVEFTKTSTFTTKLQK